jgi:hypothetical protein
MRPIALAANPTYGRSHLRPIPLAVDPTYADPNYADPTYCRGRSSPAERMHRLCGANCRFGAMPCVARCSPSRGVLVACFEIHMYNLAHFFTLTPAACNPVVRLLLSTSLR